MAKPKSDSAFQGAFAFDEFSKAIMAKIVKKCGRRDYWENWATDIAKIAQIQAEEEPISKVHMERTCVIRRVRRGLRYGGKNMPAETLRHDMIDLIPPLLLPKC